MLAEQTDHKLGQREAAEARNVHGVKGEQPGTFLKLCPTRIEVKGMQLDRPREKPPMHGRYVSPISDAA